MCEMTEMIEVEARVLVMEHSLHSFHKAVSETMKVQLRSTTTGERVTSKFPVEFSTHYLVPGTLTRRALLRTGQAAGQVAL